MRKIRGFSSLLGCITLLGLAALAHAGTTGKIVGRVVDEKDNPLPGAQAIVQGTYFGAICDSDGSFRIIQVPPGTHSTLVTMMGFTDLKVSDITVRSDLTTDLGTLRMSTEVIDLQAIEIKADRPIIQEDVTDSRRQISSETLESMPVDDYADVLEAQTSMKMEGGELHVRGGRGGEVIYMVDGMVINDPLVGGNAGLNVAQNAIEEMSVLTGGFNAEYGNAQSGVINLVTKEGNVSRTSGIVSYQTDILSVDGQRVIPAKYSFDTQHFQLSLGGPEPLTTYVFPRLGVNLPGDNLSYFLSFDGDITEGYRPNGRIRPERDVLGLSIPDRQYNTYSLSSKLSYRFHPRMKLTLSYIGSYERREGSEWLLRFTPDSNYRVRRTSNLFKVNWTHTINNDMFYTVNASLFQSEYKFTPGGHDPDWFPRIVPNGMFGTWGDYRSYYDLIADRYNLVVPPLYYIGSARTDYIDLNEPFSDGEPFEDIGGDGFPLTGDREGGEGNGTWDFGEPFEDLNGNGVYDGPNGFFDYPEAFDDLNGNGSRDENEPFQDGRDFVDRNGNGEWDEGEVVYLDYQFNGRYDPWVDRNLDGFWQPGEGDLEVFAVFDDDGNFDPIENGFYDPGERFTDWNGNGWFDYYDLFADPGFDAEPYYDVGNDGIPDTGDAGEGNGRYDPPEWRALYDDWNGNGEPDGSGDPNDPDSEWVDYNGNGVIDRFGEPFDDENWDGAWNRGREGTFSQWAQYHDHHEDIATLKFDLTSQLGKNHQTKSGIMLAFNDFSHREVQYPQAEYPFVDEEADSSDWPDRGIFRDFYTRKPIDGALYIQDKMEYEGLIVNAGLRLDFRYLGSDQENRQVYNQAGELVDLDLWSHYLSPRLGISHPITERDVLYFNYGHFVEWPEYDKVFARDTQGPSAYSLFGNPDLQPERTVAYEFGLDHAFNENLKVDVTGFFKDVFDLVNQWTLGDRYDRFYVYGNVDYGRVRGFELNFEQRYSGHISGNASYSYMIATGKSSSDRSVYDAGYVGEELPLKENYLDWDERNSITLSMDIRYFRGDEFDVFGLSLPSNWGLNLLWKYGSGLPYTLKDEENNNIEGENVANNARKPYTSTFDIKLNKGIAVGGVDFDLILDIRNVFNRENVREVESRWGTPYGDGRLYLRDPYNYHPGRNVRVGVKASF